MPRIESSSKWLRNAYTQLYYRPPAILTPDDLYPAREMGIQSSRYFYTDTPLGGIAYLPLARQTMLRTQKGGSSRTGALWVIANHPHRELGLRLITFI